MGNNNLKLIPPSARPRYGGSPCKYRKSKNNQIRNRFAPRPSQDDINYFELTETQLKPCSNKNTGNMTFTICGKMQAGGYIDVYGEMQYAPNEELNFDYGVKIGASSGLGAGVYVSVSGQIGISYIF